MAVNLTVVLDVDSYAYVDSALLVFTASNGIRRFNIDSNLENGVKRRSPFLHTLQFPLFVFEKLIGSSMPK